MKYRLFSKGLCCFILALVPVSFFGAHVYAEDAFLEEAYKIALSRNRNLVVAQEQIQLSKIRVTNAKRAFFPQVTLQHQQSKGATAMIHDVNSGNLAREEYTAESLGVKAVQPIFEGFRTKGMYDYENLMLGAAQLNFTKQREELFAQIKLAYYEYLTLKAEYAALGKAFGNVEKLFLKTQTEYKARAISELDLAEAENFRDKIEDMLTASRINLSFSIKQLTETVGVTSIDEIGATVGDELPDDVPEIAFSLADCLSFALTNNLELRTARAQIEMSKSRRTINRSKVLPKFYIEGFYGQSGEAFVTEPLELTTSWSFAGRLSWSLWGSSLAAALSTDKTEPSTIIDASRRVENTTFDVSLSLLDDLGFFIDTKESDVGLNQTNADLLELMKRMRLSVEKAFNEYTNSLNSARTFRKEIKLRERKLALMKRRNDLYEVPTLALMEESWKYAETIGSYTRTTYANHASITELENLTLMPLR
jgi:outer membrane protein TolC